MHVNSNKKIKNEDGSNYTVSTIDTATIEGFTECGSTHQRRKGRRTRNSETITHTQTFEDVSNIEEIQNGQWKRIMLLVIAITVHNIPEGLAVGVGFGAIGRSPSATFESARSVSFSVIHIPRHVLNNYLRVC